jgi:type I restriction enzyme S subunit
MLLDLRADYLKIVQDILQKHVPEREVWAFGSRAKWLAKEYSDLDLCILGDAPLSFSTLGLLEEAFDESDLPYKVDLVDWATTSESFRKIIEGEKVVIHSGAVRTRDEWRITTLGEVCQNQGGFIQTGPFGSQLHTSDYQNFGVPVVMPTNLGDGLISDDGIARIGQADADRLAQHKLIHGDIVFSRRGDVTKNALIGKREVGWLCGTGCLKVRLGDESATCAEFVSYSLRLPETKEWLVRHAVGATMPNLNTGILAAVPITLPPLETQRSIAAFLGALDARISLLRETNVTLEAIAQALFKSWFVDFDPVRAKMEGRAPEGMDEATAALFPAEFEETELGAVPKGWQAATLQACCTRVESGGTPKRTSPEYWGGNISWLTSGEVHNPIALVTREEITAEGLNSSSAKLWPRGTTVVAMYGATAGEVCMLAVPMAANQACCGLIPRQGFRSFLFFCIRREREHLASKSSGSAQQNLNKGLVEGHPIVLPSDSTAFAFELVVESLLDRWIANQQQAQTLSTLRDTLLPRLISGQLRLPEALAELEATTP